MRAHFNMKSLKGHSSGLGYQSRAANPHCHPAPEHGQREVALSEGGQGGSQSEVARKSDWPRMEEALNCHVICATSRASVAQWRNLDHLRRESLVFTVLDLTALLDSQIAQLKIST